MMLLRILLLAFLAWNAQAAAPSLSCAYSTTGGSTKPAPLAVVVDCSATTDADTTKPFHDLLYRHTFGDPGSGVWSNGANTNQSKNVATGPIAAHVYETPGTYTITTTVTDGTNYARTTQSITVADPDTVYTGTATVCIANAVATPGVGGCPTGAATPAGTTDYDAAMTSCFGTTKRCLLNRGDTFTSSTAIGLSGPGPSTIGAYGSGALPIVNVGAGNSMNFNGTIDDVRIMDLDIRGTAGQTFSLNASITGLTMLRLTIAGGGLDSSINLATGDRAVSKTVIQDSTLSGSDNGQDIIMICAEQCAILGNSIGPNTTTGFQTFRIGKAQKAVIAHNTIDHNGATNVEVVAIRAATHVTTADDSFYVVFSDNKINQGTRTFGPLVHYGPGAGDSRVYDVIHERNWHLASAYTGTTAVVGLTISAVRVTARNNLFDLSAPTSASAERVGVSVGRIGTEPAPDDANIYNNTVYSSFAAPTTGVRLAVTAANSIVKNNLCWADVGTATTECVDDNSASTTAATNSSNAQMTGTDPSFDTPLTSPIGFRIGTGSYAATGATSIFPASNDDFFSCDDITANERYGAFVPRARAGCRSGAGP